MSKGEKKKSLSLNDKLRIALTGSAGDVSKLIFDRNRKVIQALLHNPEMNVDLLLMMIKRNQFQPDELKRIANHPQWSKDHKLKLQLVCHPRTPRATAMKFIKDFHYDDLASICRNTRVHPAIREASENYLRERLGVMSAGEKKSLARQATSNILYILMEDSDNRVLRTALRNYRLTEPDLLAFIGHSRRDPEKLMIVAENAKWSRSPAILEMLAIHPNLGYGSRRQVFEQINIPLLIRLIRASQLDENHRKLARFIALDRVSALPESFQIPMAQSPYRSLLNILVEATIYPRVLRSILSNPKTDMDLIRRIVKNKKIEFVRELVKQHPRWQNNRGIEDLFGDPPP